MVEEKSSLILLEDIVPLEFEAGGSLAPAVEATDAAIPVEEIKKKRKYKREDGTSSDGMEDEVQPPAIDIVQSSTMDIVQPSAIDVVQPSAIDVVQPSAIDVVQESAVDVHSSDINSQPSEIDLQPIEFDPLAYDPLASPSGVIGEIPGETLDAKSKAALRMRQYRKDHKNDPIWLSKEAERMRKIRANRKSSLSANELQGAFVDENGVAIASPEGALGEGSSSSGDSSFIEGQLDENGVEIPRPKEIAPKKKRARKSTSKDVPQTSVASDLAAIGGVAVDSVAALEVTAENSSAGVFISDGTNEGNIAAFAEMPGILAVEAMGDVNFPSVPKKTKSDEFRKKEADRIRKYRELKRQDVEWKTKDAERMRVYRARLKEGAPEGRVKAKRAPSIGGEGKTRTKRKPAAQSSSMPPSGIEQQHDLQGMPIPLPFEPYEPEQFAASSAISTEEIKEKEDSDSEDEVEKPSEASTGMLIDETNPIV